MRKFFYEPIADPVAESRRYVENAENILKKHGQLNYETQLYQDRKYVRMAGNTLWNGMLLILDAVFLVKINKGKRPDIIDYKKAANKRDKKLLDYINVGYDIMHLSMGYDGILDKEICSKGFQIANEIIDRCELMIMKAM